MAYDKELMTEQVLRQLVQSKAPIDIMRRYHILMRRVYETLLRTTVNDDSQLVTDYLEGIDEVDSQVREFLYEEQAATFGDYDETTRQIVFSTLPPDVRLVPKEHGFVIESLPVWMLGHSSKKKYHPLYHKNRPYVRKRQLWYWLVKHLQEDLLIREVGADKGFRLRPSFGFARMVIVVRSEKPSDVRDLDHFLPPIEVIVNALVANKLILSDRPDRFSFAVEWVQDENVSSPVVDLNVHLSELPFGRWTPNA